MLNEQEKVELEELEAACLDSYGKPRTDTVANTEDFMRLSVLQEKAETPDEPTVEKLKERAKEAGIKGYANMKKETLIERLDSLDDEPEKEPAGNSIFIKSLEAKGYEYLGKNSWGQCFIGPDKKAYVSHNKGLRCVGNKFGDKLLKSLTK